MENIQAQSDKKPWYKNGLKFECQRCGNCCRGEPGIVKVDINDINRISSYLKMKQELFATQYLRLVSGSLSLREFKNGDCFMYDNGCTIYPIRPLQCRTFPFWKSNLKIESDWERQKHTCPGMDKGRLYAWQEVEKNMRPELDDF